MSELAHDEPAVENPSAAAHATQPFYWSVRRELWENRATYLAPAAVAAVLLIGALLGSLHIHFQNAGQEVGQMPAIQRLGLLELPYAIAAIAVSATMVVVAIFYCLGALFNERRDRSILFWKSLPVSDTTTVLSKVFIPLVIMPIAAFIVIEAMELAMLGLNALGLLLRGGDVAGLASGFPFLQIQAVVLYTLVVATLWLAPFYAWLLLVSAWSKRAPFLWAFLPPLALAIVERIGFGTHYVGDLIAYRLNGFKDAFSDAAGKEGVVANPASLINPASLLSLPGLWLGLLAAAALLAAAVWWRRNREPI